MVEEKKVRWREVPVTANLKTRHSEGLTGPVRRIEESGAKPASGVHLVLLIVNTRNFNSRCYTPRLEASSKPLAGRGGDRHSGPVPSGGPPWKAPLRHLYFIF